MIEVGKIKVGDTIILKSGKEFFDSCSWDSWQSLGDRAFGWVGVITATFCSDFVVASYPDPNFPGYTPISLIAEHIPQTTPPVKVYLVEDNQGRNFGCFASKDLARNYISKSWKNTSRLRVMEVTVQGYEDKTR